MKASLIVFLLLLSGIAAAFAQPKNDFNIIAYYSRGPEQVDSLPAEKLGKNRPVNPFILR